jgi:hypothetical protein
MATQANIRSRIRDTIFSAVPPARPFATLVTEAIALAETDVDVTLGTDWSKGDVLEFSDDGEQCFVQSVATNTLTVVRAYNGTTETTHASGVTVYKNPRFTIKQIDQAITNTLLEFEAFGIWVFGQGSVTLVSGQYTYNLASYTDALDVLSVYHAREGVQGDPIVVPFRFHRQVHTSLVGSGVALTLWDWGQKSAGEALLFTYAQRIDNVTDLLARQEEIVVLGASARLLKMTIAPATHDPGKRTDRTVQPGQTGRDSREIMAEYLRLANEEAATLKIEAKKILPTAPFVQRARRWRS